MLKNDVPMYIWWAGFSLFSVLGFLFNRIYLPETKGLTLAEIQAFYKKPSQQDGKDKEVV